MIHIWKSINCRSKYVNNSKLTNLTSNSIGNQIATCSDNGKIQLWNFKVMYKYSPKGVIIY